MSIRSTTPPRSLSCYPDFLGTAAKKQFDSKMTAEWKHFEARILIDVMSYLDF